MRRDPFAMLPFCGYNMADYFAHWLKLGQVASTSAPRIFRVNWFRKDANGKFIWPGFGENMRVLKWIVERVEGKASATQTPLGNVPDRLDMQGLDAFGSEKLAAATHVERGQWGEEMKLHGELVQKLADRIPAAVKKRYEELKAAFA